MSSVRRFIHLLPPALIEQYDIARLHFRACLFLIGHIDQSVFRHIEGPRNSWTIEARQWYLIEGGAVSDEMVQRVKIVP